MVRLKPEITEQLQQKKDQTLRSSGVKSLITTPGSMRNLIKRKGRRDGRVRRQPPQALKCSDYWKSWMKVRKE